MKAVDTPSTAPWLPCLLGETLKEPDGTHDRFLIPSEESDGGFALVEHLLARYGVEVDFDGTGPIVERHQLSF